MIALLALLVTARAGENLGPPPWENDHADGGDLRPPPWMPDDPGGNKFVVDPMQLLQSKDIKEELKLTDDQSQQLTSLADRYHQEIKKELGTVDLSGLSDDDTTWTSRSCGPGFVAASSNVVSGRPCSRSARNSGSMAYWLHAFGLYFIVHEPRG